MAHQFGNQLFNTSGAMCAHIVNEWMFAGGLNDSKTVAGFLAESDDKALMDDCVTNWNLVAIDEDAEEIKDGVTEVDMDDLRAAFADFRKEFMTASNPENYARAKVNEWIKNDLLDATQEAGEDYVGSEFDFDSRHSTPCPADLDAVMAAAKPMIAEALA